MLDNPRVESIQVIDDETGMVISTVHGVNAARNAQMLMDSIQNTEHRLVHLNNISNPLYPTQEES